MWRKRSHSSAHTEQTPVSDLGTVYRVSIKLPFMKLRRSFIVTEVWKCKSNLSLFYYTCVNAAGTLALKNTHTHTHTHKAVFFIVEIFRNRGHALRFVASTHRCRKIIELQYWNVRIENKQKLLWKNKLKRSWK